MPRKRTKNEDTNITPPIKGDETTESTPATSPTLPDSQEQSATPAASMTPEAPTEEKTPLAGDPEDTSDQRFELPAELPILPLKDTVVYPYALMPLGVGKDRSIQLIDDVMRGSRLVGLVAQKDGAIEEAGPDDCFRVGTVARIARLLRIPDGTVQVIVQGLERIAIDDFTSTQPYLRANVHAAPEEAEDGVEIEAMTRNAIDLFQGLV